MWTRGACGARLETLVCGGSDGGAWPPPLALIGSTRPFGRFSWASISFAARDLVCQDFRVVVVPGMRLSCLARARRERAALRAHRSLWAASYYSARRCAGAARLARAAVRACGGARVRRCAR